MAARFSWREAICGLTVLAVGLLAAFEASGYAMGSLRRMGPGFLPLVYALVLAALGAALLLPGAAADPAAPATDRGDGAGKGGVGRASPERQTPAHPHAQTAATADTPPDATADTNADAFPVAAGEQPRLRPLLAVTAGMLAWVWLAPRAGFVPATVALVLIAAGAERAPRPGQALLLGGVAGLAGGLAFVRGFGVALPLWPWP